MFVRWKKKRLVGRYYGPECFHEDQPDRCTLTPVVVRSIRKGATVKQEVLCRPAPTIRSCCIDDPIVRVGWWDEVEQRTLPTNVDRTWVQERLARRVAIPSLEERTLHGLWKAEQRRWFTSSVERTEALSALLLKTEEGLFAAAVWWDDAETCWREAEHTLVHGDVVPAEAKSSGRR